MESSKPSHLFPSRDGIIPVTVSIQILIICVFFTTITINDIPKPTERLCAKRRRMGFAVAHGLLDDWLVGGWGLYTIWVTWLLATTQRSDLLPQNSLRIKLCVLCISLHQETHAQHHRLRTELNDDGC